MPLGKVDLTLKVMVSTEFVSTRLNDEYGCAVYPVSFAAPVQVVPVASGLTISVL